MRLVLIAVITIGVLAGCGAKSVPVLSEMPYKGYKAELEEYEKTQLASRPSASLWSESHGVLFKDYKARLVGDLVTVRIVESSSAQNSNNTSTGKSTNYDANIASILGLPTNLGMTDFMGLGNDFDPTISAGTSSSFSGTGSKSRRDTVSATIAARVVDVLPSGNLVIEGQREIVVDEEKQTLTVTGVVRPKDIDASNTVLSSQIADAQIRYSGDGVLTDANRKGWMARLIDWVWPF